MAKVPMTPAEIAVDFTNRAAQLREEIEKNKAQVESLEANLSFAENLINIMKRTEAYDAERDGHYVAKEISK